MTENVAEEECKLVAESQKCFLKCDDGKTYCAFCFCFCKSETPIIVEKLPLENHPTRSCGCSHFEDRDFFQASMEDFLKLKANEMTMRKIYSWNAFMNHKYSNGKNVIQLAFSEGYKHITLDIKGLKNNSFSWENLSLKEIDERNQLLQPFSVDINDKIKFLIKVDPLFELFTPEVMGLYVNYPNYEFGTQIYDKVLLFHTRLLNILRILFFQQNANMEKIEGEDVGATTPIVRMKIREANRRDPKFKSLFLNDKFNICDFALKCIGNFFPYASWRWIGGSHKAHVFSMKLLTMLLRMGLFSNDQLFQVLPLIASKTHTIKSLEKLVDKDSARIAETWIKKWKDDLIDVRLFSLEAIYLTWIYLMDDEVMGVLKRLSALRPSELKRQKATAFDFLSFPLYKEEFCIIFQEVFFSYQLSLNTIKGETLVSDKIKKYAGLCMQLFSNYSDQYLQGIKLLQDNDISMYLHPQDMSVLDKFLYDLDNKLSELYVRFYDYTDGFDNFGKVVKDFELEFINPLMERLLIQKNFSDPNPVYQDQLLLHSVNFKIFNFINIFQNYAKDSAFFDKIKCIYLFYMNFHNNAHSLTAQFPYIGVIEKFFNSFPLQVSSMLLETYSNFPRVFVVYEDPIYTYEDCFTNFNGNADSPESYIVKTNLLKILDLYNKDDFNGKLTVLTESDMELGLFIRDKLVTELDKKEEIKRIVQLNMETPKTEEGDELSHAKAKYYLALLQLIANSTRIRFPESVYKLFNEKLSEAFIEEVLPLCGRNLKFRKAFLQIMTNIHSDLKNPLLNNRANYYKKRPVDLQYEEDSFVDKDYLKMLAVVLAELKFSLTFADEKANGAAQEEFQQYFINGVLGLLIRILSLFQMLRESEMDYLKPFTEAITQISDLLQESLDGFSKLSGVKRENKRVDHITHAKTINVEMESTALTEYKKYRTSTVRTIDALLNQVRDLVSGNPFLSPYLRKALKTTELRIRVSKVAVKSKLYCLDYKSRMMYVWEQEKKFLESQTTSLSEALEGAYSQFKLELVSKLIEKNHYLISLQKENDDAKENCAAICSYLHAGLKKVYDLTQVNIFYIMIECLLNLLYVATHQVQSALYKVIKSTDSKEMLDNVWNRMKWNISYVRFKTIVDRFWKELYLRTMILIRLHQALVCDNFQDFKNHFREKILPNDSINRVKRYTTFYQRMSDNSDLHTGYQWGDLETFSKFNKEHNFPLLSAMMDTLVETISFSTANMKEVFTYIYDRYKGTLKRFSRDPNSEFNVIKVSIMKYINNLAESEDFEVCNYLETNLEIHTVVDMISCTIRQLYHYAKGTLESIKASKIWDYPFCFSNVEELFESYISNPELKNHPLLDFALECYKFLRILAKSKTKFQIFFFEMKSNYDRFVSSKQIAGNYKEVDFAWYKFFDMISTKVEILKKNREGSPNLVEYYFKINPKSFYLSDKSKRDFLTNVDRSSVETKHVGLLNQIELFELEMDHNKVAYKNKYKIYKIFGSGNLIFLEYFCIIISFINNLVLFVEFKGYPNILEYDSKSRPAVLALTLIELAVALGASLAWLIIQYPLMAKMRMLQYKKTHSLRKSFSLLEKLYIYIFKGILAQGQVMMFLLHSLFCVLGLFVSFGFLGLDLLTIVHLSLILRGVIKALIIHLDQVIATLVLIWLLIYTYTLFVHTYYFDSFLSDARFSRMPPTYDENRCESLISCFWKIAVTGLRNGKGMAEFMKIESFNPNNYSYYYPRLLIDMSFFLVINTVLLNIIMGLVIDTFQELRQKADLLESDSSTYCFFCNLEIYIFEKKGIRFSEHIANDHGLERYINFLIYMRSKTTKDCNELEGEILSKINAWDVRFFPKGRSIALENTGFKRKYYGILDFQNDIKVRASQLSTLLLEIKTIQIHKKALKKEKEEKEKEEKAKKEEEEKKALEQAAQQQQAQQQEGQQQGGQQQGGQQQEGQQQEGQQQEGQQQN